MVGVHNGIYSLLTFAQSNCCYGVNNTATQLKPIWSPYLVEDIAGFIAMLFSPPQPLSVMLVQIPFLYCSCVTVASTLSGSVFFRSYRYSSDRLIDSRYSLFKVSIVTIGVSFRSPALLSDRQVSLFTVTVGSIL